MTVAFAFVDQAGLVDYAGHAPALPAGAIALAEGVPLADAHLYLWSGTDWSARPRASAPAQVDTTWTWTGLPTGAEARVFDGEFGNRLATIPRPAARSRSRSPMLADTMCG
ncbi:hypothetical protein RGUI_4122 [Rhodovulum sp. P5]|uniref:hypothetical protein n=1 Tax=Rhodovulum sp. P5 TaxID=1564506 RepID=UPI0009C332B4|nr:hypothetical protein [Rhodovulum sp. P5]ARE42263.1 hypothetical protein RGUI_4122 [Rhodovulum sp. P5]